MGWKDRAQPAPSGWKSRASSAEQGAQETSTIGKIYDALSIPAPPGRKLVGGTPFDNPLFGLSSSGALPVSAGVRGILEEAATSPLPAKVQKATNVVGAAKGLLGKLGQAIGPELPGPLQRALGLTEEVVGRGGAYSNIYTGVPQAISDTALAAKIGQGLLAKGIDKVPVEGATKAGLLLEELRKRNK